VPVVRIDHVQLAMPAGREAKLEDAGVRVSEDEPLDGYFRVYVDDPFGNRIELMEPTGGNTP
jgi:hypothetical protein